MSFGVCLHQEGLGVRIACRHALDVRRLTSFIQRACFVFISALMPSPSAELSQRMKLSSYQLGLAGFESEPSAHMPGDALHCPPCVASA